MRVSSDTLLINYLNSIGGDLPWIEPLQELASKLPPFLKQRYRISRADLFGRKFLLAIEESREGDLSPTEYARDVRAIKERLSADVILVLSNIPAYVRNRLVHQKVPFIVPGTQMFLPMLMIDLREQFPKSKTKFQDVLSAVSQLVILYHLLRESLSETPFKQIASRLGYSPMAITKAQDELQNAELCEVHRLGRTLSLHFDLKGKDLWQKAAPLLSTPVKRTQWFRWGKQNVQAVTAGITALSKYSMLEDDPLPTYARRDKDFVAALQDGEFYGCGSREEAQARMESWKYDPSILASSGIADPLSLYLSLRHSADERVQKEIEKLIGQALS
jgi:DNA-binding MarR family transcriptional regulator